MAPIKPQHPVTRIRLIGFALSMLIPILLVAATNADACERGANLIQLDHFGQVVLLIASASRSRLDWWLVIRSRRVVILTVEVDMVTRLGFPHAVVDDVGAMGLFKRAIAGFTIQVVRLAIRTGRFELSQRRSARLPAAWPGC